MIGSMALKKKKRRKVTRKKYYSEQMKYYANPRTRVEVETAERSEMWYPRFRSMEKAIIVVAEIRNQIWAVQKENAALRQIIRAFLRGDLDSAYEYIGHLNDPKLNLAPSRQTHVDPDYKLTIIRRWHEAKKKKVKFAEFCKIVKIPHTTIRGWLNEYNSKGAVSYDCKHVTYEEPCEPINPDARNYSEYEDVAIELSKVSETCETQEALFNALVGHYKKEPLTVGPNRPKPNPHHRTMDQILADYEPSEEPESSIEDPDIQSADDWEDIF